MSELERKLYRFLLLVDGSAILVSMVAGPLRHTSLAIGAAASAALISVCLILYGLHFWPRQ
ncbi:MULTISPECIES: hypothetical protein [unclassified Acutalibacter]|jgi:hypothetical protein|uniref:hypothetical protein n=1 Tax=unclassified Acutalibacter TaxID=2620728 RepID=UPI00137292FD|nr:MULTISPECIES: hypothetical protein [unclassified Acutalibacter]MCI9223913.1 hypothetical protein [Acutalibacter sp.]NBJ88723.1 hypothetical protein [Acutalibacter sp. 1XD8-36]